MLWIRSDLRVALNQRSKVNLKQTICWIHCKYWYQYKMSLTDSWKIKMHWWRALPSEIILFVRRSSNLVQDLSSHARNGNMKRGPLHALFTQLVIMVEVRLWCIRRIFTLKFSLENRQNSSLWGLITWDSYVSVRVFCMERLSTPPAASREAGMYRAQELWQLWWNRSVEICSVW